WQMQLLFSSNFTIFSSRLLQPKNNKVITLKIIRLLQPKNSKKLMTFEVLRIECNENMVRILIKSSDVCKLHPTNAIQFDSPINLFGVTFMKTGKKLIIIGWNMEIHLH